MPLPGRLGVVRLSRGGAITGGTMFLHEAHRCHHYRSPDAIMRIANDALTFATDTPNGYTRPTRSWIQREPRMGIYSTRRRNQKRRPVLLSTRHPNHGLSYHSAFPRSSKVERIPSAGASEGGYNARGAC
jgi:hypothetical protein